MNHSKPPENRDGDDSTELHGASTAAEGFGLRTGRRSARTVLGFAWFVLGTGTLLLFMGATIFIGEAAWTPLVLLCLVELVFIAAFLVLVNLARSRRVQGNHAGIDFHEER
ncbi:MAG: hypothetical protein Q4P23_06790 [Micrococcaceae bacterium]|nr:hypothetical protein [Micrococcaceae bacterium]